MCIIIRPPSLTVVWKIEKKFDIKTRQGGGVNLYAYKRILNQPPFLNKDYSIPCLLFLENTWVTIERKMSVFNFVKSGLKTGGL